MLVLAPISPSPATPLWALWYVTDPVNVRLPVPRNTCSFAWPFATNAIELLSTSGVVEELSNVLSPATVNFPLPSAEELPMTKLLYPLIVVPPV